MWQRALSTLGHQRRFLSEQKSQLEKWTSDVYGAKLASSDSIVTPVDRDSPGRDAVSPVRLDSDNQTQRRGQDDRVHKARDIHVHLKCKGADKRRIGALVARVDSAWHPRQDNESNGSNNRGAACKVIAEKPPKRSKLSGAKADICAMVGDTYANEDDAGDIAEDEPIDDADQLDDEVSDSTGRIWSWLEDCSYFAPICRRHPLPEDLTLEAEGRLGRSTLLPLQGSGGGTRRASDNSGASIEARVKVIHKRTAATPAFLEALYPTRKKTKIIHFATEKVKSQVNPVVFCPG